MTLTTAEQVRLRLNDPWKYGLEMQYGDGTASAYKLQQGAPYSTVLSATASVYSANVGWSGTGATINTGLGLLTFSGAISANTAFQVNYLWAVFSDAELGFFTAQGDVRAATLMGVRVLMADAWKRARWAAPDGSQYDDSKAFAYLAAWEQSLLAEKVTDDGPAGQFVNWADTQQDF